MSTVRLVIVILVLGTVLLLAVQNTSPALPLVFLGMTSPRPAAGGLAGAGPHCPRSPHHLAVDRLAGGRLWWQSNRGGRSAYKYRPQPFYEPSPAARCRRP
jgi:hypothetical protein